MGKTIYDLKLHETLQIEGRGEWVERVPGGWIYTMDIGDRLLAVFVPFNKEFQEAK